MNRAAVLRALGAAAASAPLAAFGPAPQGPAPDRSVGVKGDRERRTVPTDGGTPLTYRIYVPARSGPTTDLPLLIVLPAEGQSQDAPFADAPGKLQLLAERRGYIIAALQSENDALNVLESIATNDRVDRSRVYLTGRGAGGSSTVALGAKFAERWAGLAPLACAPTTSDDFPFYRLTGMPLIVAQGGADHLTPPGQAARFVQTLRQNGVAATYVELPASTEKTILADALPQILDFFESHPKAP